MSPRTARQNEEIKEAKRTLIMRVALEHFARDGYHNTTISHLAKHAGISKGLLYNYFKSKEELFTEIINNSVEEMSTYFDQDKDGFLSEEEFEFFIRKLFYLIRRNIPFWRLFAQLIMQKEGRVQFLKSNNGPVNTARKIYSSSGNSFLILMSELITDYFVRKKRKKPEDYDPILDLNMFIYTVEGFALVTLYMDEIDDTYFNKSIDRIIELYK